MAALLESLDYECRCFESAAAFLKDFEPETYGCLLSDVRMPGIGGLELQQKLTSLDPDLPIIFMTSVADEAIRQRALDAGAVDLLYKPIATATLVDAFETALRWHD
jgi:two-component system response regulator FixJ